MNARPHRTFEIVVFTVASLSDRAAKCWALTSLEPASPGAPLVSLGLFFNRGISFSMLDGYPHAGIALSMIGLCLLISISVTSDIPQPRAAMPLLWSGALCNLSDRLIYGHVIDWVRVVMYINLADLWLCVGCAALAASLIRERVSAWRGHGGG
ncbi:MAG: signal peptidase II [Synergistaceae bacterium]|jgi:lipoprotein signal peptidase|nr:signal peptidase II [Synergistaceae bacterium]